MSLKWLLCFVLASVPCY